MDYIKYFISQYKKLQKISENNNCLHVELLEGAVILYIFFIDKNPLFHRINKEFKIKPEFKYKPYNLKPIVKNGITFSPVASVGEHSLGKVNILPDDKNWDSYYLNKFLNSCALTHGGRPLNVRDLITFYRNEKGGAHFSANNTGSSLKNLSELKIEINNQEIEPFDRRMHIIVRSFVNGLKSFVDKIASA